jgi:N utilization substance protein B
MIDRNILRLAAFEIKRGAVPTAVAIDEALWLAHRFGTAQSPGFVNGVLDRLAHDLGRL